MAKIEFRTEWLTQIGLAAKCGSADEVVELCVAIQRIAQGKPVDEMSSLVALLFEPIEEAINEERTKSERNRTNRQQKANKNEGKTEVVRKEKEEREENKEESREESEEVSPHTPLQEDKEESKGETREEREERETRACARESETALSIFADALPAPQFVPESDPHKLTDKGLEQEFEALWLLYPRKAGKADALRHYKAARKNGTSYDEVEQGIIRYTRHIEDEQTDPQYIAMGSTWFCGHRWEDVYARHGPKPGSLEWIAQL